MLSVRTLSFGCTREVWRAREKRKSCSMRSRNKSEFLKPRSYLNGNFQPKCDYTRHVKDTRPCVRKDYTMVAPKELGRPRALANPMEKYYQFLREQAKKFS